MRVLLAGASGTLGGPLLRQLLAAGYEVCGTSRSRAGAERIQAQGGSSLVVDVMDREVLLDAVRGRRFDAVIHEMTSLKKAPLRHRDMRQTNRLRELGTGYLLEAAHETGAHRFLTQSIVFGYGYREHGSGLLNEDSPFGIPEGNAFDEHLKAMMSTEQQTLGTAGIDGIVLRYGLMYGADAGTVAAMLRRRALPVTRRGGEIPFVHHEDAASATVAALEQGAPGRVFNVVDDVPTTFREYVEVVADTYGVPRPLIIPQWVVAAAAPYGKALFSGVSMRVANDRARLELGWSPRFSSVSDGLAAAARSTP